MFIIKLYTKFLKVAAIRVSGIILDITAQAEIARTIKEGQ